MTATKKTTTKKSSIPDKKADVPRFGHDRRTDDD